MQLIHGATAPTMSSREIAELTGSTHDNVLKTVRALVEKGVIVGNETPYIHPQNHQMYTEFVLNYRDTMVVVSGYSVELRARIIDRWQELERQATAPAFTIPTTLAGALRLAADQAEQLAEQQAALTAAAPKVAFVDAYATASTGSKTFREVCKLLNAKETEFRDFLTDVGIMYRLGGNLTPRQRHIDAGRFEVKAGVSHQNNHAFNQTRFTTKGVTWIAGEWGKRLVAA